MTQHDPTDVGAAAAERRPGEAAGRLQRRLVEAYDELWDLLVDPREPLCDSDEGPWLPLAWHDEPPGRSGPAFRNEQELAAIRRQCRGLAVSNEFAINGHENRTSYIVGAGHVYRAACRKHCRAAARLLAAAEQVIDEFLRANAWHRRQQEIVLRRDRDGEVFLRFFTVGDGLTRVRFVEPGQVATPPSWAGRPEASFGILTEADDVETPRAYFIDGAAVDAAELQHRKANVDANVKRGLPLFFPVIKNLRRAEKLLRNMSVVAGIQSAIALIRRHRGAGRSAVQQFVAGQAAAAARSTPWRHYAPGTILDVQGDVEYDFPAAALDAGSYVRVLQAELRAIASRLVMPEFMLTSDASNAAYASTMVAEGPAVRMFERLQWQQIEEDREVMNRVIAAAVRAGRLPREALTHVEIQIEAPSLAVRDALREAQVRRIEHQSGILSPQTWSLLSGLDYAQEQANLAQHRPAAGG